MSIVIPSEYYTYNEDRELINLGIIIPSGYYTYNAAGKAIALISPYNTITAEQVRKINNMTAMKDLYDSRHGMNLITVLNGVINYNSTAESLTNDDTLLIVVDTLTIIATAIVDGGTP